MNIDTYLHQILGILLCQCWYVVVIYDKCYAMNLYFLTTDVKTLVWTYHCDAHLVTTVIYKLNICP